MALNDLKESRGQFVDFSNFPDNDFLMIQAKLQAANYKILSLQVEEEQTLNKIVWLNWATLYGVCIRFHWYV